MKAKFNKFYKALIYITVIVATCAVIRTGHYYITTYNDNSVNDYALFRYNEPQKP